MATRLTEETLHKWIMVCMVCGKVTPMTHNDVVFGNIWKAGDVARRLCLGCDCDTEHVAQIKKVFEL